MKYTNLEAAQRILSAMESDEVNSVNDTVESYQVLLILKSTFYDMATELGLERHDSLFELNASLDADKPTLMHIPSNVARWDWIEYDNKEADETYSNYRRVEFLALDRFLEMQNDLRGMDADVGEMVFQSNGENFNVMYRTDKFPQYFTSYDDSGILFDSYDSSIDTTIQKSKTRCSGSVYPVFEMTDTFTPPLQPTQFSYYINRATSRAFAELKQTNNPDSIREARTQKIHLQKNRRLTPDQPEVMKVARYGRKSFTNMIPQILKQGD